MTDLDKYKRIEDLARETVNAVWGSSCYWELVQLPNKRKYWEAAMVSLPKIMHWSLPKITYDEWVIMKGQAG